MRRESYEEIKAHKNFYRNSFRKTTKVLIISVFLNIVCLIGIFYKFLTLPDPDFYATNGVTAPIPLKSMNAPNMTSQSLLEEDQPDEITVKELPEGT